jgi:BirA family biotin operon repressor/biotin-[acetyl-CoA-carboxylase] ligase
MKRIHFKEIDSTNTYLINNYENLENMTVVSTDYQKEGIGRMKRVWYGDSDSIMCSILIKENLNEMDISIIPLLIAKSLHQVLSAYHTDIKIKWPNDLLIKSRKLSGILVKSIISSSFVKALIIGFGININNKKFNKEISNIATSLSLETNKFYDKEEILKQLLTKIENDLLHFNKKEIISYCNMYSNLTGKEISFIKDNKSSRAVVLKIDESGHLLVKSETNILSLNSGEVTLLKQ